MQNITANKLFHYPDRIAGDFRPITADVFITNFCNNFCSWCTYHRWEHDSESRYMRVDDFKVYLDRLISFGVQGVILTGGGEPTINPDFDEITECLDDSGIVYGINSNFNKLRFCKPEYLKISLDGYDEDSYERIRGVRSYSKVIRNIQTYIEWKKRVHPNTSVGIQMVVTNPSDIIRFYTAHYMLDVDYIVYRPVESTNGCYYTDINSADAALAISIIRDLQKKDSRVVLNYKWEHLKTRFERCSAHWAQIAIDEAGNVMYCCHKPYQIIGNVTDDDILTKYAAAVTDMSMCDVPCRLTAPNLAFNELSKPVLNPQFI